MPVLVQFRVIDEDMAAAQHVVQLRDLQAMPLQVGDDRRFLRAEMRGRGQQALAG